MILNSVLIWHMSWNIMAEFLELHYQCKDWHPPQPGGGWLGWSWCNVGADQHRNGCLPHRSGSTLRSQPSWPQKSGEPWQKHEVTIAGSGFGVCHWKSELDTFMNQFGGGLVLKYSWGASLHNLELVTSSGLSTHLLFKSLAMTAS